MVGDGVLWWPRGGLTVYCGGDVVRGSVAVSWDHGVVWRLAVWCGGDVVSGGVAVSWGNGVVWWLALWWGSGVVGWRCGGFMG